MLKPESAIPDGVNAKRAEQGTSPLQGYVPGQRSWCRLLGFAMIMVLDSGHWRRCMVVTVVNSQGPSRTTLTPFPQSFHLGSMRVSHRIKSGGISS
jgi:hypothetical protein